MVEEQRREKRLNLDVIILMENLNSHVTNKTKYIHVDVENISKSGIGFITRQNLELEDFFETKIEIWTKETIHVIIKLVRKKELDNGKYFYGGRFIGLSSMDAMKVDIYQIFH